MYLSAGFGPGAAHLLDGPWVHAWGADLPCPVSLRLDVDDAGQLVCTALVVGSQPGADDPVVSVRARELRQVRLGELLDRLTRLRAQGRLSIPGPNPDSPLDDPWQFARERLATPRLRRPPRRRPGRAGHPREHFEHFAERWRASAAKQRRSPVAALAREYDVSQATIRRWKERAEGLGLLDAGQEAR
jgi:hypothetical protein